MPWISLCLVLYPATDCGDANISPVQVILTTDSNIECHTRWREEVMNPLEDRFVCPYTRRYSKKKLASESPSLSRRVAIPVRCEARSTI